METRLLGQSGLKVPVVGVGCWSFGGGAYWGPQEQSDVDAVVAAALDAGLTFFDTAEGYNEGRSEEALGRALRGRRAEAVIATKISPEHCRPDILRAHCEASLRRLQTEVIDVYQIHWPLPDGWAADAFTALASLQEEGKVRAIGLSNFGVQQMGEVLATGAPIASNQLCYNLLSRAIEFEILPLCREHQVGVMAYMPLLQGILTGKYRSLDEVPPARLRTRHFRGDRPGSRHGQPGAEDLVNAALAGIRQAAGELGTTMGRLVIAWCIARPGIATTITGARNAEQLRECLAAASLRLLPEVVSRLDALTEGLRLRLGPNADLFQGDETRRSR